MEVIKQAGREEREARAKLFEQFSSDDGDDLLRKPAHRRDGFRENAALYYVVLFTQQDLSPLAEHWHTASASRGGNRVFVLAWFSACWRAR